MTPPPYGPPPTAASNDKTTLWGVLGIVFAFCCLPLGVVFSVLSLLEAKKVGKQPTLAYVGFGIAALSLILNIVLAATGSYSNFTSNN
ncbi:DUF4190 domain-containing protein [Symbioplanes lichenis]|uniref:DUF4190 domain-containing protein n=1 Tax=Symbioplanes lichenis TaxID=1629072 RepID=UPI0027383876|nr:DUF4190 domain-containing protein [Actinoplanes lichenis]